MRAGLPRSPDIIFLLLFFAVMQLYLLPVTAAGPPVLPGVAIALLSGWALVAAWVLDAWIVTLAITGERISLAGFAREILPAVVAGLLLPPLAVAASLLKGLPGAILYLVTVLVAVAAIILLPLSLKDSIGLRDAILVVLGVALVTIAGYVYIPIGETRLYCSIWSILYPPPETLGADAGGPSILHPIAVVLFYRIAVRLRA